MLPIVAGDKEMILAIADVPTTPHMEFKKYDKECKINVAILDYVLRLLLFVPLSSPFTSATKSTRLCMKKKCRHQIVLPHKYIISPNNVLS